MNNILGYYLMPHPPIIIPTIGRGEEIKIQSTINACDNIAKEIKDLKPETIVIITPHGTMFSDAISISNEASIKGELSKFRDYETSIEAEIDMKFNDELLAQCNYRDIPVVGVNKAILHRFNKEYELDHGTMIPLYFINKYYNDYKLVHITYSILSDIDLYKFGAVIDLVAKNLNRKTVVIASGDLSHKLSDSGPYEYSPQGEVFDKELLDKLQSGDALSIFNMDKLMVEEAGECGLRSVNILLGAMDKYKFKGELLSYEGTFGVGYGVMKFKTYSSDESVLDKLIKSKNDSFNEKIKNANPYVKLARESLNSYYLQDKILEVNDKLPKKMLEEKHGVFVSLKKYGQLRGCIGTIFPATKSVAEEIIRNSIQAATKDPRFMKVTKNELEDIDISVDVLTDPIKTTKDELDPKRYGVIVSKGYKKGLLLPDLEGVDTIDYQLQIACEKAGIDYDDEYEIEKFEVIRYKEGD